ncbi:hypothetical protein BKA82DRAFT_2417940 [Pisolithus tinctorius]|nr:hypothetical protein BKA82DRAFT_2417940 [Pisolithus tinctorius]
MEPPGSIATCITRRRYNFFLRSLPNLHYIIPGRSTSYFGCSCFRKWSINLVANIGCFRHHVFACGCRRSCKHTLTTHAPLTPAHTIASHYHTSYRTVWTVPCGSLLCCAVWTLGYIYWCCLYAESCSFFLLFFSLSLDHPVSAYTLDCLNPHACPRSVVVVIRTECAHPQ